MYVVDTLSAMPAAARGGSAVALGFFDGVHLGHRAVLDAAADYAAAHSLTAAAFTFDLPISSTMKGKRLLSEEQKQARVAEQGIAEYMAPPFADFCALTPLAFVQDILCGCFGAKAVFCGENFTFGARAAGNVAVLRELGAACGMAVEVVPMRQYRGEAVSSTRIRAALAEGDIPLANALLGAPYAIDWPVCHGQGLGKKLGAPTINQNYPAGTLQPCCGVYITRARIAGRWYAGATGLGGRPTVADEGAAITCETYLPDFSGNLYGKAPLLEFHQYLGPTQKFDSLEELRACIFGAAEKSKVFFGEK